MPRSRADFAERAAFYASADRKTPHLTVATEWGLFLVPTGDEAVGRKLFERANRTEIKVLRRVVRALRSLGWPVDGTTFVDVGANIGTTTVPALTSFAFAHAVAVEPEPENARVLRANLALNAVDGRATVVVAAASDRSGEAELALHERNCGAHELAAADAEDFRNSVRVPVVTLDRLARRRVIRARSVGLLWLDVQGHEGHVLSGAESLTRRGVPLVLELYRDGLERSGGFPKVLEAAARYTHFVEVRSLRSASVRQSAMPVAELASLAAKTSNTDVLLLRLT